MNLKMNREQTLAFKTIESFEKLVKLKDPTSSKETVLKHLILFNTAVLGGLDWDKRDDAWLQKNLIGLAMGIHSALKSIEAEEVQALGERINNGGTLQ